MIHIIHNSENEKVINHLVLDLASAGTGVSFLTWLQVLMSTPFFRNSRTLSIFPALAARRKLVLLSDYRDGDRMKANIRSRNANMYLVFLFPVLLGFRSTLVFPHMRWQMYKGNGKG